MCTDGRIIIQVLMRNRVKILYLMQFYEINVYQVIIFKLYIFYNKHEMIKICNHTREKLQVISQVLK